MVKRPALIVDHEKLRYNNKFLLFEHQYNIAMQSNLNPEHYLAFQVLDYVLCSAPGAPLKQALVDKKVGKDVYSLYESTLRQPYFSVVAKDTSLEKQPLFLETIEEVVKQIVKEGFDKKALLAGINYYEFKYRI